MGDEDRGLTTAEGSISEVLRARVPVHQLAVVMLAGVATSSTRLRLDDRVVSIGRDPTGDVVLRLADSEASRLHARVEPDADGGYVVTDCGSRNGTIVDGARIEGRAPLRGGGVVRVGRSLLVHAETVLDGGARLEPESGPIRGASLAMQRVRGEIARIGASDAAALILGESGTGKELVAAQLHAKSGRKGPFIALNCAAIPSSLAESELFGHAAGAFTGATERREGAFAAANGGTLFLDEIGELDAAVQAKLLRVLSTGELRAVGRTEARRVDVRIVSATHRDLRARVDEGTFRGDLLARISATTIVLPPLRDRRDDVLAIATAFLEQHFAGARLTVSAAEALLLFDWPYNVRQLENVLRGAALGGIGEIRAEALPDEILQSLRGRATRAAEAAEVPLEVVAPRDAVPDAAQLETVVRRFKGNLADVASYFRKDRKQIYRWAERLGVDLTRLREP
jgi:DNA-binding NtrC family response regulator